MTTEKEDTDPSTPASLRPGSVRRGYGLREAAAREPQPEDPNRPTTDPGLGPAARGSRSSETPPPSGRRGVVVPPPSSGLGPNAVTPAAPRAPASEALSSAIPRAKESKDSVELLLDGMSGPRPERRKTTPQSDGEASASYHARHGVHAAHAPNEPGPKVVVDRTPSPPASEPDTVPTPPPAAVGAMDTTFVPARNQARRIALAILAALLIVLGVFVAMDLAAPKTRASAPAPSAEVPVVTAAAVERGASPPPAASSAAPGAAASEAPSPVGTAAPEPTLVATTRATAAGGSPSAASAEGNEVAKPAVSTQAEGAKRRHRGGASDDLGEFKTSF
jgi:hypothetical protein